MTGGSRRSTARAGRAPARVRTLEGSGRSATSSCLGNGPPAPSRRNGPGRDPTSTFAPLPPRPLLRHGEAIFFRVTRPSPLDTRRSGRRLRVYLGFPFRDISWGTLNPVSHRRVPTHPSPCGYHTGPNTEVSLADGTRLSGTPRPSPLVGRSSGSVCLRPPSPCTLHPLVGHSVCTPEVTVPDVTVVEPEDTPRGPQRPTAPSDPTPSGTPTPTIPSLRSRPPRTTIQSPRRRPPPLSPRDLRRHPGPVSGSLPDCPYAVLGSRRGLDQVGPASETPVGRGEGLTGSDVGRRRSGPRRPQVDGEGTDGKGYWAAPSTESPLSTPPRRNSSVVKKALPLRPSRDWNQNQKRVLPHPYRPHPGPYSPDSPRCHIRDRRPVRELGGLEG